MDRSQLPLSALRAFEAAARHLSFTRAAAELCVSQAALSHQIKALEQRLGVALFRRLPRGVALTDEGLAMVPALQEAFDRLGAAMDVVAKGPVREVISVAAVTTFALGWLLPRLDDFRARHPEVELRLSTNNNRVDLAGEGLHFAIRFGDGSWHGTVAIPIMDAPLSPLCAPHIARDLRSPPDIVSRPLLRSFRSQEWPQWFHRAGLKPGKLTGPVFDSSLAIAQAAKMGAGIGLLPLAMFADDLDAGLLVQPFDQSINAGRYWLTRLQSRPESSGMSAFRHWMTATAAAG